MEYKTIPYNIKRVDGRKVTGFPAIIGNIDAGNDRLQKGAFKKTLQRGVERVKHLWQHDFKSPPIARIISLEEVSAADLPREITKAFPEATGGLKLIREYLNTPRAEEVLQGIMSGTITEMSFGYDPVKFDYEEVTRTGQKIMVRNLREVHLWDTSDVNWGMNPATVAAKRNKPEGAFLLPEGYRFDLATGGLIYIGNDPEPPHAKGLVWDFTTGQWVRKLVETPGMRVMRRIIEINREAQEYQNARLEEGRLRVQLMNRTHSE